MRKVSRILMSIIVIILAVLGLFNMINSKITIPIILIILGILNISNGYSSYINDKKGESILLISSGLFIVFVSIYTTFF
ncbi:hypothetical protein GNF42_15910 [Clostridium perfringens]|uniref:hypothetical protein n=1 Tax=Clostridium perfringens TaxID=1502 RepID=UPI002AC7B55B|nr:hypothetical protein [Clostridium perfringens]MDZ4975903.1 hypothetical protein [Clostridium perfringens]